LKEVNIDGCDNLSLESKELILFSQEEIQTLPEEEKSVIDEIKEIIGQPLPLAENDYDLDDAGIMISNGHIQALSLRGLNIESIPVSIANLEHLEQLILGDNEISELPNIFDKLTNLKTLSIEGNPIKSLPDTIRNLEKLKEFFLSKTFLEELPESIGNLKSLDCFYLENTSIKKLPSSIGKLTSLSELNLASNESLQSLSDNFGELSSLKELDLSYCTSLKSLPDISNLTKLNSIRLDGCSALESLNESIGKLEKLEQIDLGDCSSLKSLPETIGNLKKLAVLDLYHCSSLESLPESIGNLEKLIELKLSFCEKMKTLPKSIKNLQSLISLDISNCGFEAIPVEIMYLKSLDSLNISGNILPEEEQHLEYAPLAPIVDYLEGKIKIKIYISCEKEDVSNYNLSKLNQFLEDKDIIEKVIISTDLSADDRRKFAENFPISHVMLFLATKKSVFDSKNAKHEIDLAKQESLIIVPIKGGDVNWGDLSELNLSRELGFEIDLKDYDKFCNDVFNYIVDLKGKFNLVDKDERKIGKLMIESSNLLHKFLQSASYNKAFKNGFKEIRSTMKKLGDWAQPRLIADETPVLFLVTTLKILAKYMKSSIGEGGVQDE
ncbi:MAG: leucine-rich repeat domain-containing protein, partial [Promethearchaeota archaeon]